MLDRMFPSRLLSLLAVAVIAAAAAAADIKPADSSTPLFRIFASIPMKPGDSVHSTQLTFDDKHPLLVLRSVSNLQLARDDKSVLITLTPADAKKFADITRKYNQGLLLLEGDGRVLEAMHVTAPIVTGIIGFKHPEEGAVAEYLRRRFRISEFK